MLALLRMAVDPTEKFLDSLRLIAGRAMIVGWEMSVAIVFFPDFRIPISDVSNVII